MIEKLTIKNINLGVIIRSSFKKEGIEFFTEDNDFQQLGYMNRPEDYIILPHKHNRIPREIDLTQEVLFIKSGLVRADFYSNSQEYLTSRILSAGDVILLADGGHGFKMLEPSEIIEVKQGPYCGERDKVRFEPVQDELVQFN